MSIARVHELERRARRRHVAIVALLAAPVLIVIAAFAWRMSGWPAMLALCAACAATAGYFAYRSVRAIDGPWIVRRLDAAHARFEDSADLFLRDEATLLPLQRLQQQRLHERMASAPVDDVAAAWPWRAIAATWILALVIALGAAWLPRRPIDRDSAALLPEESRAAATHLESARLDITPPAYTKRAPNTEASLEARVAAGSRIVWHLRFAPQPSSAALSFHDGSRVALTRDGDDWTGARDFPASALYRVELKDAPPLEDDGLRRIDAIPDRPPDVRVIQPEKSLTLLADGQTSWDLDFEASDDYGIAAAKLAITLAQGTGENIAFKEQTIALDGEDTDAANPGRTLRYRHRLDLAALGIAKGDDVVVRLFVSDHREPEPNTTKSASFILRWPPETSSESVGMEGLVEKTMPAYFRSQRQIIVDTEALIAEQAALDDDKRLARSDAIGVDQKILRLRYGQFLGEEFETKSAPSIAAGDAAHAAKSGASATDAARADALADSDHDHATGAATTFGDAGSVVAEYGHTHDHAEAATLLDPETKAIVKSALAEMWQSELHLRQGHPSLALPYEYKALGYIKEIQQSTRIYLARVGLELPAVDEGRRLSGDRKGVVDRESALVPADVRDADAATLWRDLDAGATTDLDAFERWIRAHESTLPDALSLLAATDRVRRDPACAECRVRLRAQLWPLLSPPATAVGRRAAPDAAGQAYLDAIGAKSKGDSQRGDSPR